MHVRGFSKFVCEPIQTLLETQTSTTHLTTICQILGLSSLSLREDQTGEYLLSKWLPLSKTLISVFQDKLPSPRGSILNKDRRRAVTGGVEVMDECLKAFKASPNNIIHACRMIFTSDGREVFLCRLWCGPPLTMSKENMCVSLEGGTPVRTPCRVAIKNIFAFNGLCLCCVLQCRHLFLSGVFVSPGESA